MSDRSTAGSSEYWRDHFAGRHREVAARGVAGSLDYSNERVRLQTYASLLEGLGPVAEKRVLDVGCGWGSLALALHGCGAEVVAIDIVSETIDELTRRYPFITWRVADLARPEGLAELGSFDAIVAAEVFQYVDFGAAVAALWRRLEPGGRLVAAVPNAACPIAGEVAARLERHWRPVAESDIHAAVEGLEQAAPPLLRGLDFQADQSFLPYRASAWEGRLDGTPNRIVMALLRLAAGEARG